MALRSIGRKLAPSSRAKLKPAPKMAESFYLSPEWRMLCEEIKRERWPHLLATQGHCCEDQSCNARHSRNTRIFFDHLIERRDRPDLALVKSNIMGRCGSSHSKKTAIERARRMHG
ncbi:HNH endonuclease (plasmid) [Bradyrhizobium oligotrophicum S58]